MITLTDHSIVKYAGMVAISLSAPDVLGRTTTSAWIKNSSLGLAAR